MLRSSRARRAFTVLETVVALAISSLILLALVLWVSSLMRSTTSAIQMSASNRSVRTVSSRLEADIIELEPCAPNGTSPALVKFTAADLGFYADVVDSSGIPGSDGLPDYVLWRFDGSTLARGVLPGDGTCPTSPPSVETYLVFQSTVSLLDGAPVFSVYRGTVLLDPEEDCLAITAFCRADSLRLRALLDDAVDEGAAPTTLDLALDLSHAPVRL